MIHEKSDTEKLLDALERTKPAWSPVTRADAARLLYLGSEAPDAAGGAQ
jgi:hypothetical protein